MVSIHLYKCTVTLPNLKNQLSCLLFSQFPQNSRSGEFVPFVLPARAWNIVPWFNLKLLFYLAGLLLPSSALPCLVSQQHEVTALLSCCPAHKQLFFCTIVNLVGFKNSYPIHLGDGRSHIYTWRFYTCSSQFPFFCHIIQNN